VSTQRHYPERRRLLLRIGLAAAAIPAAAVLGARPARAASMTSKADVHYQFMPHGAERCGLCASFVAGGDAHGPGSCRIVDGPIPQDGWCVLFARR
jgi:hypothetical protein